MTNNLNTSSLPKGRFGTLPVFLTAISTILGAIMFLRFGYAVGNLGFFQTCLLIILGHLVTIPTAMAIAEIATNQRVEGGGEYFIISRSFGISIGSAIGVALYLSQAISVAFYIIAFGESFEGVISWLADTYNIYLTKKIISLVAMGILAGLILLKGADLGVAALYVVVAIIFVSLLMFFVGANKYTLESWQVLQQKIPNGDPFFYVFAICFPAFTGMTAGVGLSGDLRNPSRSIPLGTLLATLIGMVVYILIALKLAISADPQELVNDQFVMAKIAVWGPIIPIGLAAATVSSALGSILVAPRTLQALAKDNIFPTETTNQFLQKGKGKSNEPFNASLITIAIAFAIIFIGDVNFVAEIISMFFMVTYGSLCLISFLHYFNASPSYRPVFRSPWYISLAGAIMCIWLMFKINTQYAVAAFVAMMLMYWGISYFRKAKDGLAHIFEGIIWRFNRMLQLYLQKADTADDDLSTWRPAVICVSNDSFKRLSAFDLLEWIAYRYGFSTYIHQIDGYYSKATHAEAEKLKRRLIDIAIDTNVFVDTLISPSYTSAIAQAIQLPGISGKENNTALFEFSIHHLDHLKKIIENFQLVKAGNFDVCILCTTERGFGRRREIHIWLKPNDYDNANMMILLGYILMGHPDWQRSHISIFSIIPPEKIDEEQQKLKRVIEDGRLPISMKNVEIISQLTDISIPQIINEKSASADLTIMGFRTEMLKARGQDLFLDYTELGNILFVNSTAEKLIT
ncbi:MAG: amino acid permease [Bacteroidetes bacterium]|nr:amino acid permease [Bacteroidota bacterium]MCB9042811.1 amino acid permease [Chitinophagales bacterium]